MMMMITDAWWAIKYNNLIFIHLCIPCVPCAYFILRNQELTLFLVSVWACRVKIKQVVRWYKTWFSWKSSFDKCNEFSTLILKRFLYVYREAQLVVQTVKKRKFNKKIRVLLNALIKPFLKNAFNCQIISVKH